MMEQNPKVGAEAEESEFLRLSKMDIEFVEGWPKENKVRLLIKNTDSAQVNALRRTIIADVPKLAISRVDYSQGVTQDNKGEVYESVNALPDEVLAHRLAMVQYQQTQKKNCISQMNVQIAWTLRQRTKAAHPVRYFTL